MSARRANDEEVGTVTLHTPQELYLYAKDKMERFEREAHHNRLLEDAELPPFHLGRSLAGILRALARRLAPEVEHRPLAGGEAQRPVR